MKRTLPFMLLCGCYTIHSMPLGEAVSAMPQGCAVHQELLSVGAAEAAYQQVGVVCLTGPVVEGVVRRDQLPVDALRALDREACGLGGDVVVLTGFCADGAHRMNGSEWRVYRNR
jgi:hypothetical protein